MVHFILAMAVVLSFSEIRPQKISSSSETRTPKISFFFVAMILLTLFSALRYEYGNDYNSYRTNYEAIRSGEEALYGSEFLFGFLNKISPNYYFLVAIISVFFMVVVYKLINKNLSGTYRGLAILVFVINPYVFLVNLSALRQCSAMCLFVIATIFLKKRKIIPYILIVLVASSLHMSAIILLPIYFLINDKPMGSFQIALFVVCLLALLVEGKLVNEIIETGLTVFDNSQYSYYYEQGNENSLRATILFAFFFAYVVMNLKHLEGYRLICGKLYLVGLFLSMISYHLSMLARMQMYFEIFSVVTLPAIIQYHMNATEEKWKKFIHLYAFPLLLLAIYFLRYVSFFANPTWDRFLEYHTIFEAII